MTTWHHAYLAVSRRRTKSLVLALILILISTVFVVQGVMSATINGVLQAAEKQVPPGFTLTSSAGDFRESAATSLLSTPHVVAHHFMLHTSADSADGALVPVTGTNDPARTEAFEKKEAELVQAPADAFDRLRTSHGALLEEGTAQQMQLSVGSQLTLSKDGGDITVPVVGLYRSTSRSASGSQAPVLLDLRSAQRLAGKEALSSATLITDSPAHVEAAMEHARTGLEEGLELRNNVSSVAGILDSVSGLTTTLTRLLWALVAAGAVVLVLVLVFWTRSRTHEVGVLLSLGHSKRRICGQLMAELLMLTLPSLVVALAVGEAGGYVVTSYIHRTIQAGGPAQLSTPVGALVGSALLAVGGVLILATLALMLAMTQVIRLRPKEILAKMS
nr:ABC transporter permease [Actinomyces sp.]